MKKSSLYVFAYTVNSEGKNKKIEMDISQKNEWEKFRGNKKEEGEYSLVILLYDLYN